MSIKEMLFVVCRYNRAMVLYRFIEKIAWLKQNRRECKARCTSSGGCLTSIHYVQGIRKRPRVLYIKYCLGLFAQLGVYNARHMASLAIEDINLHLYFTEKLDYCCMMQTKTSFYVTKMFAQQYGALFSAKNAPLNI